MSLHPRDQFFQLPNGASERPSVPLDAGNGVRDGIRFQRLANGDVRLVCEEGQHWSVIAPGVCAMRGLIDVGCPVCRGVVRHG